MTERLAMGKMISVVMATYNGSLFIRAQLNSILAQTIQDYEVVVCDDCSSDNTWAILNEYATKDSRFRLFQNEYNIGFRKNIEQGILLSKGDYVALCDQDDIWTDDHLEVLLNHIGDKMISAGDAALIDEKGNQLGVTISQVIGLKSSRRSDISRAMTYFFFSNQVQGASMLIRREFFSLALPLPDNIFHDAWFSLLSCFWGGMSYTFHIVNNHRRHKNNVSALPTVERDYLQYFINSIKYDCFSNSEYVLDEILKRVVYLPFSKRVFIGFVKRILHRDTRLQGRVINGFIKFPFFRVIYGKSPGLMKRAWEFVKCWIVRD